jgi:hypothetical protein
MRVQRTRGLGVARRAPFGRSRAADAPPVRPTVDVGDHMSDQEKEVRLEGIVYASRYDPSA